MQPVRPRSRPFNTKFVRRQLRLARTRPAAAAGDSDDDDGAEQ